MMPFDRWPKEPRHAPDGGKAVARGSGKGGGRIGTLTRTAREMRTAGPRRGRERCVFERESERRQREERKTH